MRGGVGEAPLAVRIRHRDRRTRGTILSLQGPHGGNTANTLLNNPARALLQMSLGSEGLLQCHLVMCVLEFPVLPLGGSADPHCPNGHPSLGRPRSLVLGIPRASGHGSCSHHCLTLARQVVLQGHRGLFKGRLLPHNLDLSHLNVPQLHLGGAALHVAVVAAARAALHLHAGRPHQEVGVGAVYEAPGDLKHLGAGLALSDHGWLSNRRGT